METAAHEETMMATTTAETTETRSEMRRRLAREVLAQREGMTGARVELAVATAGHLSVITVPVDVEQLSPGAREAVAAGLLSTRNDDDASRLVVLTGRTVGEARRERRDRALTTRHGAEMVRVYGLDEGLDDATPETERVRHHVAWLPEAETPEACLSRALAPYAGRIVRAGL